VYRVVYYSAVENREKLLNCALELFAANGYDAVGVQAISDAAGVKKPTLYHYFGSKSGLLDTLLKQYLDPFFENLTAAADYRGDITMSLRAVAETYFSFARRNPRFYRFFLSMWFAPQDSEAFKATRPLSERQQALLEALFQRAAQDHGNMQGRHQAYAASFLGMINTYVILSLNGYAELNDDFVYRLIHQFMHGIFS
jgi:AcrR family transcriptional regulator